MQNTTAIIKGIHPGIILERELKKRNIGKGKFAISLNEFPQTLVTITKGKRSMNTALAFKIEKSLGFEEGYFMILQVYYDIKKEKEKLQSETAGQKTPNLSKLRPALFWDTAIEKINWEQQKKAVVKRVFNRGNTEEKNEIKRFYGEKEVNELLNKDE